MSTKAWKNHSIKNYQYNVVKNLIRKKSSPKRIKASAIYQLVIHIKYNYYIIYE